MPDALLLPLIPNERALGLTPRSRRSKRKTWAEKMAEDARRGGWEPPTHEEIASLNDLEKTYVDDAWEEDWTDWGDAYKAAWAARKAEDHERELILVLLPVLHASTTPVFYERAALLLEREKKLRESLAVCDLWLALPPSRRRAGMGTESFIVKRRARLLRKLGKPVPDLSDPEYATNFPTWVSLRGREWLHMSAVSVSAEITAALDRFEVSLPRLLYDIQQLHEKVKGMEDPSKGRHGAEDASIERATAAALWSVYRARGGKGEQFLPESYFSTNEELEAFDEEEARLFAGMDDPT